MIARAQTLCDLSYRAILGNPGCAHRLSECCFDDKNTLSPVLCSKINLSYQIDKWLDMQNMGDRVYSEYLYAHNSPRSACKFCWNT